MSDARIRNGSRWSWFTVAAALLIASPIATGRAAEPNADGATAEKVEFNRDIRPIFSENCYACHGPDKGKRKASLRLDQRESAIKLYAIVPGKPDDSELVYRILSEDDEDRMPPVDSHKTLTQRQKDLIVAWIAQGAQYQEHWSYVVPSRPAVPTVQRPGWVQNPIDAFILAPLESKGIEPSPEASRRALIRRLSLDLLGLPPSPEEVREFENDQSPDAYERLVDRLLDSPHYGERMAVPWLDLARFADTVGYHGDQGQRVFPYRDYVINAFNHDKPFDQFTIEQLAGDLLPEPTTEQLIATGFNRLNMVTREGGAQPEEYLAKYAGDRVRTVSLTWLGSTMGCCECHDHKFDPFSQRDFYTMAAFFADVKQWGVYNDYDYTPNPELKGWSNDHPFPPEIEVESESLQARNAQLADRVRTAAATTTDDESLAAWLEAMRSFLSDSPSGWRTLSAAAASESEAKAQPDGSLLIPPSIKDDPKEGWAFQSKPGAGWVARIKVELLPDATHNDRIARGGAAEATVSLTTAVQSADSKEARPVKFFLAEADHKEPRYFNGDEVPGVLNGWRTSRALIAEPQSAVWCLDPPIQLKDAEALAVAVKGKGAGRVRVSFSPFGFELGGDLTGDLAPDMKDAIEAADAVRSADQTEAVKTLHQLATAADPGVWERARGTCMEIAAHHDGRTHTLVTKAAPPLETRLLPRGDWLDRSGPIVEPAVPHFLPHQEPKAGERLTRLDLARWIVAADNPLTARVFMNRLWKQFFGVGLSAVVEDVGAQGEWPVHPELLDWLAIEFREAGWSVKHMVKLMVMSSAYRQDSRQRPELIDDDPGNRWVAYQSPRRLEAEFVRDNALAVAGLLKLDLIGGPSVFPYQPAGYYANLQFPNRDYIASAGDLQYRRGVYMHWQRTFLHPMLANFDAPSREECSPARTLANTPQQALTLLNDPTFVEASRVLAESLLKTKSGGDGSDEALIDRLYQRALARSPKPAERSSLVAFLNDRRDYFRENPDEAEKLLHVGQSPPAEGLDPAEAAAWTLVSRVALNLHETITRY